MQDPSYGVHRDLIQHVHLLSTYRFPVLQALHPDKVAEWLLAAPKIARDQAPFYWTYLDRPADGTILLTWQSLSVMGTDFPSDGYVWAPVETAFQLEVSGGYTLEMYHLKTGYAPGEPYATHSRRRYRLLPPKFGNMNGPSPDLSLWIIHYAAAELSDRVPSNVIPIDMRIQNTMNARAFLQQQGQIVQKDFMLHDRGNWPTIQFPRGPGRGPPMYGVNMPPARTPQTMAYPTQQTSVGPPTKRIRTQPNPNMNAGGSGAVAVLDIEDEEDTSRGDLFDHTTPREISMSRYKQNHEWMEEVLSSPYSIRQIIPADLGLGVRGELEGLTEGIFDAPFDPEKDTAKYNYVGRLDAGKADEFRQRVKESITKTNNDIEKMKAKHEKRLAKFQKGSLIRVAERDLRTAATNPSDTGPEYWRLEGRIDEEDEDNSKPVSRAAQKVDDIIALVEATLGRHVVAVQELRRIQDGGYEEAPAVSSPRFSRESSRNGSQHSGVLIEDVDIDMGGSAAGLLDQFHTGLSSNATPGSSFPTPQPLLQAHSSTGTPGHMNIPSPLPMAHGTPQHASSEALKAESTMAGAGDSAKPTSSTEGSGTGDWVVVPRGGISPIHSASTGPTAATNPSTLVTPTSGPQATTAISPSAPTPLTNDTPLPDFGTDPNDFGDLGDLDTAGDALAGYSDDLHGGDDVGADLDLGLDMDVGMDDSAFGEAFHGVESRDGEGDGEDGL